MSVIKQLSAKLAQSENERHSHLGKAQSSPPAIQETKVVLLSGKKCKQGPVYHFCSFACWGNIPNPLRTSSCDDGCSFILNVSEISILNNLVTDRSHISENHFDASCVKVEWPHDSTHL